MKLKDAWGAYDTYTGKVSDLSRQLSFAGIAIVWIFKIEVDGSYKIPAELTFPLIFISISLLLDLLQYLYGSVLWKIFARKKELQGLSTRDEFGISPGLLLPMDILLYAKVAFMIIAYIILLLFLFSHVINI